MNTADKVRQAKGPQEAILVLAEALDELSASILREREAVEEWTWKSDVGHPPIEAIGSPMVDDSRAFTVEEGEDSSVIHIKPVSEEKRERRYQFAESTLRLGEALSGVAVEDYAIGGPVWLYNYDRDFVMGLPVDWRRVMVADVLEDDAEAALEMGRDLLKDESPGVLPSLGGDE